MAALAIPKTDQSYDCTEEILTPCGAILMVLKKRLTSYMLALRILQED